MPSATAVHKVDLSPLEPVAANPSRAAPEVSISQIESLLVAGLADVMDSEDDALQMAIAASISSNEELLKAERALDDSLAARGLERVRIPGDGNCQYGSVLTMAGFVPSPAAIEELRNLVAMFLNEHKPEYIDWVVDSDNVEQAWAGLIKGILTDQVWGDQFTLVAMAHLKQCEFVLVEHDRETVVTPRGGLPADAPCFYLAFRRELHYDATRPLEAFRNRVGVWKIFACAM